MKTEIENSIGRIHAQVDRLGGIINKGFTDAHAGARVIQKGCSRIQSSQQESINLLKGINNG